MVGPIDWYSKGESAPGWGGSVVGNVRTDICWKCLQNREKPALKVVPKPIFHQPINRLKHECDAIIFRIAKAHGTDPAFLMGRSIAKSLARVRYACLLEIRDRFPFLSRQEVCDKLDAPMGSITTAIRLHRISRAGFSPEEFV